MNEIDEIKKIITSMMAKSPIGAMKISSTILLSKIDSIKERLNEEKQIELAIQQMTGFRLGRWGADPIELISSMGLKEKEWKIIKKKEDSAYLDKDDIREIDKHFKGEQEK